MVNFQEIHMKIPLKCIKAQQGNFMETYQQEGNKDWYFFLPQTFLKLYQDY